jgi:hypothetical protein
MNQIFNSSHFSKNEYPSAFLPGEAVVIKEFRTSPLEIVQKLNLGEHFSAKIMQLLAKIRTAAFSFAVDAATGYIHGVTAGKRGDHHDAFSLVEMIMRDKTGWIEAAYPMTMHCVPSTILVEESNQAFRNETLQFLLGLIHCEVRTAAHEGPEENLFDVLAAQIKTRPVQTIREQSFFDHRAAAGSVSSGALEKLNNHLTAVVGAYNHYPSPTDGRTPHERMAEHDLPPAADAETMRLLFGARKKRMVDADGTITVFGIPYCAKPGDAALLYADPKERWVAVDYWDLSSVSVFADDGIWYQMRNGLQLEPPMNIGGWRGIIKNKFLTGELRFSDFGLKDTETFDDLDFLDELGKIAEVVA